MLLMAMLKIKPNACNFMTLCLGFSLICNC